MTTEDIVVEPGIRDDAAGANRAALADLRVAEKLNAGFDHGVAAHCDGCVNHDGFREINCDA